MYGLQRDKSFAALRPLRERGRPRYGQAWTEVVIGGTVCGGFGGKFGGLWWKQPKTVVPAARRSGDAAAKDKGKVFLGILWFHYPG